MTHVRGVHDTGGLQRLNPVRSSEQRGKLMAKLTRLDHQKALLERQLAVWTEKQKVTKDRVILVEQQMANLERLIRASAGPSRRRKQGNAFRPTRLSNSATASVPHDNMKLEY